LYLRAIIIGLLLKAFQVFQHAYIFKLVLEQLLTFGNELPDLLGFIELFLQGIVLAQGRLQVGAGKALRFEKDEGRGKRIEMAGVNGSLLADACRGALYGCILFIEIGKEQVS